MSHKNQNKQTVSNTINTTAMQAGLLLMTAAATLGMIEMPEHANKVAITAQPAFAMVTSSPEQGDHGNAIRREREEVHPQHLSYSTAQRSPGRTGRA